jgi:hypothetical protein
MAAAKPRIVAPSNRVFNGDLLRVDVLPGATSRWREADGNAYWLSSRCFYCIVNARLAVIGKTICLRSRRGAAPSVACLGGPIPGWQPNCRVRRKNS